MTMPIPWSMNTRRPIVGAGVDFDPGEPAAPMGEPAGQPAHPQPQSRCDTHRCQTSACRPGIAGQDLPPRPGGGIPVEHDGDVFAKAVQHAGIFAFPTGALNYWGDNVR